MAKACYYVLVYGNKKNKREAKARVSALLQQGPSGPSSGDSTPMSNSEAVISVQEAATTLAAYSIFSRKTNDEEDLQASPISSRPCKSTDEQSACHSKAGKEIKSHRLDLDNDEGGSTAITVFNASSLTSNHGSLAASNVSTIRKSFYANIAGPGRMVRKCAFVLFCRRHILRAVVTMLLELDAVFSMSPRCCPPSSTLIPATSLLDSCYAVLGHNTKAMCPILATALLALESAVHRASSAASLLLLGSSSSTSTGSAAPEVLLLQYFPTADATKEEALAPTATEIEDTSAPPGLAVE